VPASRDQGAGPRSRAASCAVRWSIWFTTQPHPRVACRDIARVPWRGRVKRIRTWRVLDSRRKERTRSPKGERSAMQAIRPGRRGRAALHQGEEHASQNPRHPRQHDAGHGCEWPAAEPSSGDPLRERDGRSGRRGGVGPPQLERSALLVGAATPPHDRGGNPPPIRAAGRTRSGLFPGAGGGARSRR
jgi:hypothetical protein